MELASTAGLIMAVASSLPSVSGWERERTAELPFQKLRRTFVKVGLLFIIVLYVPVERKLPKALSFSSTVPLVGVTLSLLAFGLL